MSKYKYDANFLAVYPRCQSYPQHWLWREQSGLHFTALQCAAHPLLKILRLLGLQIFTEHVITYSDNTILGATSGIRGTFWVPRRDRDLGGQTAAAADPSPSSQVGRAGEDLRGDWTEFAGSSWRVFVSTSSLIALTLVLFCIKQSDCKTICCNSLP